MTDRESESLAIWLKKYPEIKIVSRDRYGLYALGIRAGSSDVIQVADRFHLIMNLGEAAKRIFQSNSRELNDMFTLFNDPKGKDPYTSKGQTEETKTETAIPTIPTEPNAPHKQFLFDRVKELQANGISIKRIAKITNLAHRTVRKHVLMEKVEKRDSRSSTNLEGFINYLLIQKLNV